jgi:hypothetical protein
MPRKTDFQVGMEAVLNNPKTSFLHSPKVFHELYNESGMTMSAMMKHIGRRTKSNKNAKHEKTDEEKSEERIKKMEETTK